MKSEDAIRVHELEGQVFSKPWSLSSIVYEVEGNPLAVCFVAILREEVVGYIIGWSVGVESEVGTFAIDPRYRGNKIGQRLLSVFIERQKRNKNIDMIHLEIRRSNRVAQTLYTTRGFRVSGVRAAYYADTGEDALLMTLSLKEGKEHGLVQAI